MSVIEVMSSSNESRGWSH